MQFEHQDDDFGQSGGMGMDADAVCAECGTVNPEDTLLCKTCGNNLREQRARRVAEQAELLLGTPARHSEWLKIGLFLLAALVVVYTALNSGRIARMMVGAEDPSNPRIFWSREGEIHEEMLSELRLNPVTAEEIVAVRENPEPLERLTSGRYVLVGDAGDIEGEVVGTAVVRVVEDGAYFAANLPLGVQVRGFALSEGNRWMVGEEMAGVREGKRRYYPGFGRAVVQRAGTVRCEVQSDVSPRRYTVLAYYVP